MKNNLFTVIFSLLILTAGNAHGSLFTVDAALDSTSIGKDGNTTPGAGLDTGIYLSAGQMLVVSADPKDLWAAGGIPRWSNADGLVGDLYATGHDESLQEEGVLIGTNRGLWTQSDFTAPFGALVGKLGDTFFLIGTNFSGPAPSSGALKLFYWDRNNDDNVDSIAVNVVTVPESGSLILLGLGLLAVAVMGRQARRP